METGRARQLVTADEVFDLVREDLHRVERAIDTESATSTDTVRPISKYLLQNGGERLRAALLLLCARLVGGAGGSSAIRLGAVVEMMQAAALVHGDMMGAEQIRRKRLTGNIEWDVCTPVLAGDWLFLGAFRVALQEHVFHLVIGVAQMMVMAELTQLNRSGSIDITVADCMEQADRKTACLFSVCGKLGAVSASADAQDGERLAEFAWNLGMAFQLIDNTYDFVSRESAPCRPAGGDLKGGRVTLPLVYALEDASVPERDLVAQVLRDRSYDAVPFAKVLAIVDRHRGIERTRARAVEFTDRARQIVAEFPDSLCRRALLRLADLMMERDC
jgi:octaprenyl-diphosphate synthase